MYNIVFTSRSSYFSLTDELSPEAEESPEPQTKEKIQQWFEKVTQKLEIDIQEVSHFKSLNGLALNNLKKEDWLRRSPNYGDILFNMWQDDQHVFPKTGGIKENDKGELIDVLPTAEVE